MDTLKHVYLAIADESLHTKKEIAAHLGQSAVTIGKAVNELISAGLIISEGKISGDLGRKSESFDVSDTNNTLLIDLTESDFSYSFSPMSRDSIDPITIKYISSLDFTDNVSLLLSRIHASIKHTPKYIFAAVPGICVDGKLVSTHIHDYSTISLTELFKEYSFTPTDIISCSDVISRYNKNTMFVHVGNRIFGSFQGKYLKSISEIPVGGNMPITYGDALKCSNKSKSPVEYTIRFLSTLNAVLSPDSILLKSDRFTGDEIEVIIKAIPNLIFSPEISPMFYGLMDICIDQTFDKKDFPLNKKYFH